MICLMVYPYHLFHCVEAAIFNGKREDVDCILSGHSTAAGHKANCPSNCI